MRYTAEIRQATAKDPAMDLDYESPNITRMTLESDSCLIEHTALTEKYQNAVVPDNIYEELEGMLIDFVHIPFRTKFKLQKTIRITRQLPRDDLL